MNNEIAFFKTISKQCLEFVASQIDSVVVSANKKVIGDIATNIDVSTEELIVDYIQEHFPDDAILAEEGFSDTAIEDGRLWVIDPICGTTNVSRGNLSFCTNIALLVDKEIVAALVIDYSRDEFVWSVGDGVFLGEVEITRAEDNEHKLLDVDTGCIFKGSTEQKSDYINILSNILSRSDWMISSLGTSLSAMYVATGRFDGNLRYLYGPWDVCSAVFLTRQMGGFAVTITGKEWTVFDKPLILARDAKTRDLLLEAVA